MDDSKSQYDLATHTEHTFFRNAAITNELNLSIFPCLGTEGCPDSFRCPLKEILAGRRPYYTLRDPFYYSTPGRKLLAQKTPPGSVTIQSAEGGTRRARISKLYFKDSNKQVVGGSVRLECWHTLPGKRRSAHYAVEVPMLLNSSQFLPPFENDKNNDKNQEP